jgi:hypothetical protein
MPTKKEILSQYLSELGKRGGQTSSANLSPAKRKARAKLAAAARWKKTPAASAKVRSAKANVKKDK